MVSDWVLSERSVTTHWTWTLFGQMLIGDKHRWWVKLSESIVTLSLGKKRHIGF